MKKLLCIILCLVLSCLFLASCGEEEIGKVPSDYPVIKDTIDEVALNMYIIVEDETVANGRTKALNTVRNSIKQYTLSKYKTELTVNYVTASEYEEKMLAAVNATDATAANVVLVNSYELMQKLYATNKLCKLDGYLDTTDFGRLNTTIPTPLFEASRISETVDGVTTSALYTIPNNHVVGEYEYLVINKAIARDYFNFNETTLKSWKSFEDASALIAAIEADGTYQVSECIYTVNGSYEDRNQYTAAGNYCNIAKSPVADKEAVFASAFAIIDRSSLANERAMKMIFAINLDTELRNLLQYGVRGTNYTLEYELDELKQPIESTMNVIRDTSESNLYYMNLIYTGNVFNAHSCSELGWDNVAKENGALQNADIIIEEDVVPEAPENNETTEEA